jgi:hypothetical protein
VRDGIYALGLTSPGNLYFPEPRASSGRDYDSIRSPSSSTEIYDLRWRPTLDNSRRQCHKGLTSTLGFHFAFCGASVLRPVSSSTATTSGWPTRALVDS